MSEEKPEVPKVKKQPVTEEKDNKPEEKQVEKPST